MSEGACACGAVSPGEKLPVDAHYFVRSKHSWVTAPEGAASLQALPEDGVGVDLGDA